MMDYFWNSKENIPEGLGFKLFGGTHLCWLLAALITFVICCVLYRFLSEKHRRFFLRFVAVLMVVMEILKNIILLITGEWYPDHLPLHLCGINIFVCLWHSIKPNSLNRELLYALGMPGAMAALLFSNWTMLPCMNFFHIHSFVVHILLVMYPLVLLFSHELRPDVKQLPKCLLFLLAAGIPLFFLNKALDTNFMFLNRADTGNPLSLFEAWLGRPCYIIGYIPLISVVWFLMYLPWSMAKKKQL